MRRSRLICCLAALCTLGFTVFGATSASADIIGYFEGQVGGNNAGTGAIALKGWALADAGVKKIVVHVDGYPAGQALYGNERPDIDDLFPSYPDSEAAGFGFRLDTTAYTNGVHRIEVEVFDNDGDSEVLDQAYHFQFNNNTTILTPFGAIGFPTESNAEVFGVCDLNDPDRRLTVFEGWALDLGVEIGDTGVSWIEMAIDGSIQANTRTGCIYLPEAGGLTNCYGLPTLNVERLYPFAVDGPNAGYRFAIDVGFLISGLGYSRGQHVIKFRAGDVSNQFSDFAEMPVVFHCIEDFPNEGSFGRIERPRTGRQYRGEITARGWVVDWEGVDRVKVYVDGALVGTAEYGVDDRPSVYNRYPSYPDAAAPVWTIDIDTTQYSDGVHEILVRTIDTEGHRTIIGKHEFVVNNGD